MLWTDHSVNSIQLEPPSGSNFIQPSDLVGSNSSTAHTIAFVDAHIADAATVMANLQSDVKILLDSKQDGIGQITEVLSHYQKLTGIEIISHGNVGAVELGNNVLSAQSLSQYTSQLQQWHNSLAAGGDILFYGCNVAAGSSGQSLLNKIGTLTGADIAASTNITGNSAQGGDWQLEYNSGSIETRNPFANSWANTYQGTLANLFGNQTPANPNQTDGTGANGDYELGMEFKSAKAGQLNAVRYYKSPSETGSHVGKIWSSTGTLLGSVTFTNETASGWQQQALATPINIAADTTYVVSVNANSHFAVTGNGLGTTITNGDLSAVADGSNGVYNFNPGTFPALSNNSNNYFRDVDFTPTAPIVGASVFGNQTPANLNQTDGVGANGDYELGMEFKSAKAGTLNAIRYYKSPSETGSHIGKIWSSTGTLLGSVTFTNETASGWQQQALATPINITANTTYVVSVNANSHFAVTGNGLGTTITNGDLSAVADGSNGVYNFNPGTFPALSNNSNNYFRDVLFTPTIQPPNQLGTINVSGTATPNQVLTANVGDADGLTGVTINYQWQQSADNGTTWNNIAGATNQTLTLGAAQTNNRVRATASYTDALGTAENVLSAATNVITGNTIFESVFSTQLPDSINQTDGVGADGDYELGMEFTSIKPGQISAVRYYKSPSETGSHVGRIWSSTGTLLGSVTFTNETASGWQQQALAAPINIAANTTYVVSVNANSHFVVTGNGLGTTIINGDLRAVADGSNGIYNFTPGAFPSDGTTNNNYFRDIVFTPNPQAPNKPGTISVSGTVRQNQVLTANVADLDGLTGVTIKYQWQQSTNGTTWTNISGAKNQTLTLGQAQVNNRVRATASYIDALGNTENTIGATSVAVVNVNDIGTVILKGSATVGRSLTETVLDADGITANINYAWQRSTNGTNWTNIAGATNKTLALGNSLLGQRVRVRSTYTDALGTSENVVSAGTLITAQNAIVLENQQVGTIDWQISETALATNNEIAGYGDATSINKGQALNLKVSLAQAGQYTVDVYRLGYYNGEGGRLMTSATGLNGVTQAAPTIDPITRLVECNWNNSYTIQTAATWTSGMYLAKLTDSTTGKQSFVEFTVRDDGRPAELGFQEAATTAAAYNNYGGYSAYTFNSINGQAAHKVSFDRPLSATTNGLLTWEYQTARWMESQGYDISYYTNLDVQANPNQLYSQNAFISSGHDEYWSLEMRNNVEKARDNGTNLGFFSANSAYWRVRFEPSTVGAKANRTMAIYKDDWELDPIAQLDNSQATTRFRSVQVNRPENALLGIMYTGDTQDIAGGFNYVVTNAADPYFANTGLANGDIIPGVVGYEWDAVINNGFTPAGLVVLSQSPVVPDGTAPDLPPGTNINISNSVRYTAASGAKVFSSGTIQWGWGLDSELAPVPSRRSPALQKLTTNILADLGAQAQTPQIFPAVTVPTAKNQGRKPNVALKPFVKEV